MAQPRSSRFAPCRLAAVAAASLLLSQALFASDTSPSDYQQELADMSSQIERASRNAFEQPSQQESVSRYLYLLFQRAGLTGDVHDLRETEVALERGLKELGSVPDMLRLRVHLDLKCHLVSRARADLDKLRDSAESAEVLTLTGDVALQEGRYTDARQGYQHAIEKGRTWDNIARLAFLESQFGNIETAEKLYVEAEDEITAKEMRAYAWVELQRGLLEFKSGRFETALAHYTRADRSYSGYWLTQSHLAEVLGAMGQVDKATALYKEAITQGHHPEIAQQLGDLLTFAGKPDLAKPSYEQALAEYRASAERGEILYLHHLSSYYADSGADGPTALAWAQKDAEARPEAPQVRDGLAWALYRNGRFEEAFAAEANLLASGIKEPHLLFHAAMICMASGRGDQGKQLMDTVAAINPKFISTFHVHR